MLQLVTRVRDPRGGNIQANRQLVREMYGQGPQGPQRDCCIDANGDGVITFEEFWYVVFLCTFNILCFTYADFLLRTII